MSSYASRRRLLAWTLGPDSVADAQTEPGRWSLRVVARRKGPLLLLRGDPALFTLAPADTADRAVEPALEATHHLIKQAARDDDLEALQAAVPAETIAHMIAVTDPLLDRPDHPCALMDGLTAEMRTALWLLMAAAVRHRATRVAAWLAQFAPPGRSVAATFFGPARQAALGLSYLPADGPDDFRRILTDPAEATSRVNAFAHDVAFDDFRITDVCLTTQAEACDLLWTLHGLGADLGARDVFSFTLDAHASPLEVLLRTPRDRSAVLHLARALGYLPTKTQSAPPVDPI